MATLGMSLRPDVSDRALREAETGQGLVGCECLCEGLLSSAHANCRRFDYRSPASGTTWLISDDVQVRHREIELKATDLTEGTGSPVLLGMRTPPLRLKLQMSQS